ncbi:desmoplakin-B isoform X2 [Anguilla rostrata]|uniref:desmoplakin-B isoform X2 n=1 Tax=Anguilla rostrata TaxID=7938 RepID=UPI0030CFBE3D
MEQFQDQLRGIHFALNGTVSRKKGSLSWEDPGRSFHEAIAWIGQQKRLVETSSWGDTSDVIDQQIINHNKFHSTIQRSPEVDKARDELIQKGDKAALNALEQEWDSLQKLSFDRTNQLRDLQKIIQEISQEIMWVNEREEEELMFDWGDKNIDVYVPNKQESYSKLMSDLEEKEKFLNKLKHKVDGLLKNAHPASDKIEAYMDTLQTQWSWLLQITKCIQVHLKENSAYSQFFKEANETYSNLQKEHENVRKKFTCDKNTPLDTLQEMIQNLEKEKERIMENKRQVQHLVNKSKAIVRLRPRNPEEKSNSPVIVQALCDYMQDQKVIFKGNEGILKDNTERSKWQVMGPGGLDMIIPSVCLLIPPPNPLSINLASKNEQYYEAILGIWNQLYINIKSLISWQYCLKDISYINSLTITMISKMRPEEYRNIIKSLETHYQEFSRHSKGSDLFVEDDKKLIETQYTGAQTHYDDLVVQLPAYTASAPKKEEPTEVKEGEKAEETVVKEPAVKLTLLTELQLLRQKIEAADEGVSQHLLLPLGEDGLLECSQRLLQLERIEQEVDLIRDEYLKLKEKILKSLEGMSDSDKVKFLRLELNHINLKLGALEGYSSSHTERMKKQMALLQALMLSDDVIKVYEARLTEKETTSLDPDEVEEYMATLKHMRSELDDKSHIVSKLEAELSDCVAFHTQVGQPCPKCQLDLTKYSELTGQLADRWHRIHSQFDSRLLDLEKYLLELKQYRTTSTSLGDWVDATRQRQDALQSAKFDNVTVLMEHVNQQKALNSEIKEKREVVEDVLKDASRCVASIKDCELQLASYASGLETLLNIPIKRTMLQSPAATVTDEAGDLQARYVGLLANSNDYGKFLAEMLKCMEELKIRNTRIDLLEEELRLLREEMEEKNQKNKSLGDLLAKYQLELTESKDQLLSLEEVKRSKAMECDAAKDDLTAASSQISELNNKLAQLTQMLEEEQRKKRLLEETYKFHQEEYEVIIRKRQKELEEANCAKIDIEKTVKDKEREIERLQMQLENEASRKRELESELSKVRNQYSKEISDLKTTYESEIHITKMHVQKVSKQKEDDSSTLKTQYEELANEKRDLQDELNRLRLSMTEVEAMRRKAEEEVRQQRSAGTEESTMRKELTVQIDTLIKQRGEVELQHKEALAGANRLIQEKNNELTTLTQNLEEEYRKKRALEAEISKLKLALNELQEKYASSVQVIDELKVSSEEVTMVKVELQKQTSERSKVEKSIADLQGRIRDLERMLEAAKAEAESHKKASLEEASRRQRVESELNTVRQSLTEHTTTINLLRKQQEETSTADRRGQQERRGLQESLDKSLRDQKAATEKLAQLSAELEALRQQLAQERARVREANLRNESLSKTMEEKSRALNSNATEIGNLQSLTQKLTKERLTLEEELRALKQELGDLRRSKESSGQETMAQISTLQLQLQNSSKASLEYQRLMEELSKEREKLRLEIDKIQKQATEASMKIQQSQGQHDAILKERDSLLLRIKQMDQDKAKSQKNDEELKRVKVTLESELRLKQRLQEENNKIRKDFEHWKTQYELKEKLVRQYESEKGALEKERNSLKKEVERLLSELKLVEERYKVKLQSTEKEMQSLASLRDSLEAELRRLRQRPDVYHKQTQTEMDTVDTSTLLFDGIRQKVTAHQLHDCRIIDKVTLSQLLRGQKTVQEVALDIQLYLKGTGAIAGMDGPEGRMSFTEAKNQDLLTPQSASKLLEAQAATGFIIDPKANEKMAVDVAVTKHLVDFQDRDLLLTAENACTGFKDPSNGKLLSAGQAMKKGWIDWETTLRLLQAQESVGGIVDPVLSVFLTKDAALDRDLIDEELYSALNKRPRCYIDPVTQDDSSYIDLKVKCRTDPATGLLLLSAPQKPIMVKGLRREVSVNELVDSCLLEPSDVDQLRAGKISSQDIEIRLRQYLQGSTCIAGIFDEANGRILPIYQAMKEGLLRPGASLELLEAQAASGFVIDPINNLYLTVEEAVQKGLVGKEFKDKLLSAERAVTGYKHPKSEKLISLFQAIETGLIERGHGIRLLEAQIASGGIIDPKFSHRIDVDVAYQRGYFDKEMSSTLTSEDDDSKGFFDPNTEENLTYLQLKKRCTTDKKTGLVLLPLHEKKKSTQKNTLRKRRVVIVDPDTNKEMSVKEAYDRQLIDYETYLELTEQECEWEEIAITAPDGSIRYMVIDRKTGIQYDVQDCLEKGLIDKVTFDKYRSKAMNLTQFMDIITSKASPQRPAASTSIEASFSASTQRSAPTQHAGSTQQTSTTQHTTTVQRSSTTQRTSTSKYVSSGQHFRSTQEEPPLSPNSLKHIASISITLASPSEVLDEQSPVGAIFDSDSLEKITIMEALNRGILDSITAQRLLEAQACTGGIIDHTTGKRLSVQEAARQGIIDDDMATKLKPAQKAHLGFEDVKTKRKMSAVEAIKERWLPYGAGQRFLEFQYVTGGLFDPEIGKRRTLQDVVQKGWLDSRAAQKLQDTRHHSKNLTCPKTKLKISYKEAMDNCMVEEGSGLKMLQATSVSSKGISSPYNVSSAPGSRSGSRTGSRRGSIDLSSRYSYNYSFSSRSVS